MSGFIAGDTSKSLTVFIADDTGLGVTGLLAATFPPVYWTDPTGASTQITLTDLASLAAAWSSGGVKERSGGYYRLDVPNALFVTSVVKKLIGEATGKHLIHEPIQVDIPVDTRKVGGTAQTAGDIYAAIAALPTAVWNFATRTVSAVTGGINVSVVVPRPTALASQDPSKIVATRGSTLRRTFDNFGDLSSRTAGWFAVKEATTDDDADALLWITEDDGLVLLNGEAVDLGDAGLASLSIDGDGKPLVVVDSSIMAQIANVNAKLVYGCQFNTPDTVEDVGIFYLTPDVVRTTE